MSTWNKRRYWVDLWGSVKLFVRGEPEIPNPPRLFESDGVRVLETRVRSEGDKRCAHNFRKINSRGRHLRDLNLPDDAKHEDYVCIRCTHIMCYTCFFGGVGSLRPSLKTPPPSNKAGGSGGKEVTIQLEKGSVPQKREGGIPRRKRRA